MSFFSFQKRNFLSEYACHQTAKQNRPSGIGWEEGGKSGGGVSLEMIPTCALPSSV